MSELDFLEDPLYLETLRKSAEITLEKGIETGFGFGLYESEGQLRRVAGGIAEGTEDVVKGILKTLPKPKVNESIKEQVCHHFHLARRGYPIEIFLIPSLPNEKGSDFSNLVELNNPALIESIGVADNHSIYLLCFRINEAAVKEKKERRISKGKETEAIIKERHEKILKRADYIVVKRKSCPMLHPDFWKEFSPERIVADIEESGIYKAEFCKIKRENLVF